MNLDLLINTPAWNWPDEAGDFLLGILKKPDADPEDLLTAAELAGEYVVVNDEIARTLLAIACNRDASDELRCVAAVSLGPALEDADTMEFDDPEDTVISEAVFNEIKRGLRKVFMDADAADAVRRSVLEAAVRAPEDWQVEAVRGAYSKGSPTWKLTAVFCMRFVGEFEKEIIASLKSDDPAIFLEAVLAAGSKEIDAAWPIVERLLRSEDTPKDLRVAAIDASVGIRPEEAMPLLVELSESTDEEIAVAAEEALAMLTGMAGLVDDDFDEDDGDDDEGDSRT